jgi:ABC-type microcin C transport system duplicated ATPase subunit YejF
MDSAMETFLNVSAMLPESFSSMCQILRSQVASADEMNRAVLLVRKDILAMRDKAIHSYERDTNRNIAESLQLMFDDKYLSFVTKIELTLITTESLIKDRKHLEDIKNSRLRL